MTDTPSTPGGYPFGDSPGSGGAGTPGGPGDAGTTAVFPPADQPAEPGRKGRRGLVIGSVAAVLAVLAGVAVYATTTLSGGGRQPDELVPRSTFAYVKVDLDPAAGQKLAAREFLGKFPDLKDGGGDENPFEAALAKLLSGEELDYKTDVQPWFDKRVALAAFPRGGETGVVAVLRSKDDGKARSSLDRAVARAKADGEDLAYRLSKGYAVIGQDQASVDDAIRLSGEESLRENTTYRADVDRLTGDQVAVAWADLAPAYQAGKGVIPIPGFLPIGNADQVKGRAVAGVHFAGSYVEAEGMAIDVPQQRAAKTGDLALLRELPDSTVGAVAVNGLGASLGPAVDAMANAGLEGQIIQGVLTQVGLSLEDDVLPLFGDQTVIALGRVFDGFRTVSAALVSEVADPAAAKADGDKLAALGSGFGIPLEARVEGNTFVLGTSDFAGTFGQGADLGASPKFTATLGGDVTDVTGAFYLDAEAWLKEFPNPNLRPLKAVGGFAALRDGQQYFRMRATV